MKKLILTLAAYASAVALQAQTVYDRLEDPNKSFHEKVKELNEYFTTHSKGKGSGYKMFKRWENEMKFWIDEKGDYLNPAEVAKAAHDFRSNYANRTSGTNKAMATWAELGPWGWSQTSSWSPGLGRIDAIAVHPLNNQLIYAGSPYGGCWKTTNGGTNWTSLTDGQTYMRIGDVEVDPTNQNIVYIGTMGSGFLKSTNGGTTLTTTGTGLPGGINIRKIIVDPTNAQNVLVATSSGVYRSTNGGANFTLSSSGSYYDMDFKPGDPTTVYACGQNFYKSTNSGASFTQITNGISVTDVMRLAVSAADPNLVCVVQCAGSVFGKFYKSTNSGTSFVTTITGNSGNGTNFFGYSPAGTDNSGQGGYNIDITISPSNANEIHIGGIITWKSTDGGNTFTATTEWDYPNTTGYTHCDMHALEYVGNNLYTGSDGGISISTDQGGNFSPIGFGMGIRMFYRLGCAATNSTTIATGAQDNGGSVRKTTGWVDWIGADGMEAAVDQTNANIIYGSSQNGSFYKSTNGGNSFSNLNTPSTNGNWTTPFVIDPNVNTTLYVGYDELYKSTNSGGTWSAISALNFTNNLDVITVAPSNSNYIYIASGNAIYRTTNGGTNWTNISAGLGGATINGIAVHNSSPTKIAVAVSGSKIYTSTNGGTAWTNSTGNFPAVTARCIVYQNDASEGLYVGTNFGVYYKDLSLANWIPYDSGLPLVGVEELEIYYAGSKLRAATYGRGIWECDLYSAAAAPPIAVFSSDKTVICPGQTVNYVDQSGGNPNAWAWTFQGGSPATSTVQNPSVTYSTPGTYSTTLIAYNSNGSDTMSQTVYITVTGLTALPLAEGFTTTTFPPTNWTTVNANNDNVFWVYTNTAGSQGSNSCMMFDNYTLDAGGIFEDMQTPKYSFAGLATAALTFDVAYRVYDTQYSDTMQVLISTNCGVTFTSLYSKGGSTLASVTGTQTATAFVPTATQWRAENISLNSYVGQGNVMIVFRNRGHWGQALYVDNINITSTTGISVNNNADKDIVVFPNPTEHAVTIQFNEKWFEGSIVVEGIDGKRVLEQKVTDPSAYINLDLSDLATGTYFIKIMDGEKMRVKKVSLQR